MIIAGLDVAFSNDYMALVVVQKGSDKKIRLVHLATWKKMDWNNWKQEMKLKQSQFRINKIYVDETNNLTVVMELKTLGMWVEGVKFTNTSKQDMITNVTKQMVTGEFVMPIKERIHSPVQRHLWEELRQELYEQEYIHDSANPKLTHPQGRHDDLLWALCLALYGVASNPNTGPPVIRGGRYSTYDDRTSEEKITDNVLRRFRGSGFTDVDTQVWMPGDDNALW